MRPKLTTPAICPQCNEPFTRRYSSQTYCSRACFYPARKARLLDRFWSKVNKQSGLFWNGIECWMWAAGADPDGYGIFAVNRRSRRAHRFIYELRHGPIPDGLFVCHHCDRPGCMRDEHHFLGTDADNLRDAAAKGRTASGERNPSRVYPERYPRGERCHNAHLTAEDVRAIRASYTGTFGEIARLARAYGVTESQMGKVIHGRSWRHVA